MLKLSDITKTVPSKQKNLLTGKRIKTSKKKTPLQKAKESEYIEEDIIPLNTEISKKYKGSSDNIAGAIDLLPKEVQILIRNGDITRVIARAGRTIYEIDRLFTFIIEDKLLGTKHKYLITIKQKKQILLRQYI